MAEAPQKWPPTIEPLISLLLTTVNVVAPALSPLDSLKIRFACVVDGYVNFAMPLRVVAVSSVVTPLPSRTL